MRRSNMIASAPWTLTCQCNAELQLPLGPWQRLSLNATKNLPEQTQSEFLQCLFVMCGPYDDGACPWTSGKLLYRALDAPLPA